ncbi:MAG TPA: hypothetical protein VF054_20465 [Micromonosporaceae bacterium]
MAPRLRDERLAWLAVRDELNRRARRGPKAAIMRLLGAMPLGGTVRDVDEDRRTGVMMRYSLAVQDVAQLLRPEEREVLRESGQVPPWFLEAVTRRYRELRRFR